MAAGSLLGQEWSSPTEQRPVETLFEIITYGMSSMPEQPVGHFVE
jgi:hypothetical protein